MRSIRKKSESDSFKGRETRIMKIDLAGNDLATRKLLVTIEKALLMG